MAPHNCVWIDVFSDKDRNILQDGLMFTDTASVLLSLWLNLSILLTNLKYDLSYRNLAFFTIIPCLRRILSLLHYLFISKSFSEITDGDSCAFDGFWNTFLSVYEVECLTHVCIERYVVAKYINNGWEPIRWHYTMYQGLCVLFGLLYSVPPLFGIGDYALDFTCTSCASDMVLSDSWHKYLAVMIFLLRSVKSASFMVCMIYWARKLENNNQKSSKMMEQAPFTKSVLIITIVNLFCWWPITTIRGSVVLSQFLYGSTVIIPSANLIQLALSLSSVAPALTSVAFFTVDERIREAMKIWKKSDVKEKKMM